MELTTPLRPGEVECRLLIPSKMGGAVIGKKGSNIQKLRSEFSASIRIPDAPGPERIMGISSEELMTCCQVVEASLPFMFEDEDENRDREIRVLFHQSVVGKKIMFKTLILLHRVLVL